MRRSGVHEPESKPGDGGNCEALAGNRGNQLVVDAGFGVRTVFIVVISLDGFMH
jgi:hypothetical protein